MSQDNPQKIWDTVSGLEFHPTIPTVLFPFASGVQYSKSRILGGNTVKGRVEAVGMERFGNIFNGRDSS